jgi:hypothetical protein
MYCTLLDTAAAGPQHTQQQRMYPFSRPYLKHISDLQWVQPCKLLAAILSCLKPSLPDTGNRPAVSHHLMLCDMVVTCNTCHHQWFQVCQCSQQQRVPTPIAATHRHPCMRVTSCCAFLTEAC